NRGTHFSRPHLQGAVGRYMNHQVRARQMLRTKLLRCLRTVSALLHRGSGQLGRPSVASEVLDRSGPTPVRILGRPESLGVATDLNLRMTLGRLRRPSRSPGRLFHISIDSVYTSGLWRILTVISAVTFPAGWQGQ